MLAFEAVVRQVPDFGPEWVRPFAYSNGGGWTSIPSLCVRYGVAFFPFQKTHMGGFSGYPFWNSDGNTALRRRRVPRPSQHAGCTALQRFGGVEVCSLSKPLRWTPRVWVIPFAYHNRSGWTSIPNLYLYRGVAQNFRRPWTWLLLGYLQQPSHFIPQCSTWSPRFLCVWYPNPSTISLTGQVMDHLGCAPLVHSSSGPPIGSVTCP